MSIPSEAEALLRAATFITAGPADRGAVLAFGTRVPLVQPRAEVVAATLVATAHGVYELELDGEPVSDQVLAPGWTAYPWRLAYQQHDVAAQLRDADGDTVTVGARVGNGWWRGRLGFGDGSVGRRAGVEGDSDADQGR